MELPSGITLDDLVIIIGYQDIELIILRNQLKQAQAALQAVATPPPVPPADTPKDA